MAREFQNNLVLNFFNEKNEINWVTTIVQKVRKGLPGSLVVKNPPSNVGGMLVWSLSENWDPMPRGNKPTHMWQPERPAELWASVSVL